MSFDIYAAPVPVPENRRDTMIGIRFHSQSEALDRVYSLCRLGWFVYRLSGPEVELTEEQIKKYYYDRSKAERGPASSSLSKAVAF